MRQQLCAFDGLLCAAQRIFRALNSILRRGHIGFDPIRSTRRIFRCFWSLDCAWGEFELDGDTLVLRVLAGALPLKSVRLPSNWKPSRVMLDGDTAAQQFTLEGATAYFTNVVTVGAGQSMRAVR